MESIPEAFTMLLGVAAAAAPVEGCSFVLMATLLPGVVLGVVKLEGFLAGSWVGVTAGFGLNAKDFEGFGVGVVVC